MKKVCPVALLAAVVVLTSQGRGAAPHTTEDDSQRIIFLGENGPLLIRLHLRVDGRSHRAVWREAVDRLFDYLDADGDGTLSGRELAGAPPTALLTSQAAFFGRGQAAAAPTTRDGKMTRQELAEHYRAAGLAPFHLAAPGGRPRLVPFRSQGSDPTPPADAVTARLFKQLDADGDGKLSRRELQATPRVLGKLDSDEDELITADEVMGRPTRVNSRTPFFINLSDGTGTLSDSMPFHLIKSRGPDGALAKRLLARYAKKEGRWNEEELERSGDAAPDVVLTVRLGNRAAGAPLVEVNRQSKRAQVRVTPTGATLKLDGARMELDFQNEMGPGAGISVQQQFVGQFKAADKKGKGYLERAEVQQSQALRPLFGAMDHDGDGKLTEKEMLAYLAEMAKVRGLARRGCLSLLLKDQGKGLFDAVDTNGDGRLSVRELRDAPKTLTRLDVNGDGTIDPAELPRRYRGTFEGGRAPGGSGDMIVFYALSTADAGLAPLPAPARGPLWFRKMDRNRDGDVSPKEWLGTDEEFRKIDSDGDGLISLEEAERSDRMRRKK